MLAELHRLADDLDAALTAAEKAAKPDPQVLTAVLRMRNQRTAERRRSEADRAAAWRDRKKAA